MATLTPRGFEDVALDQMVTIVTAYVTAQKAAYLVAHPTATAAQIVAAVGFTVERDRLGGLDEETLKAQAAVVMGFSSESPDSSAGKTQKRSKASFFLDCYTARGESAAEGIDGDKAAKSRLLYLKAQSEAAIWSLFNYHLGFSPGVIGKKSFGTWQDTSGTDEAGERWVVSGRWTFDLDYEWAPESPQGVALDSISVNAGLWSGLYTY